MPIHSEVENELRKLARKDLASALKDNDIYVQAAEKGIVSFDDLYFLYLIGNAHNIGADNLEQTDRLPNPVIKESEESLTVNIQQLFTNADNIRRERYDLVARMTNCSPQAARERYETIQKTVVNSLIKKSR